MIAQFWESQSLIRSLYSSHLEPVCKKYQLTHMELDVLLFLANNPAYDTATDIVEKRLLTKSHVSLAVNSLSKKGYLFKTYAKGNRKTIHLSICNSASPIISDGRNAQRTFGQLLLKNFSFEDLQTLNRLFSQIDYNIHHYFEEEH